MISASERGQSLQVGAILLFGIFIISLSFMQANVIPEQNAEIEFTHYLDVSQDMTRVWNGIFAAGTQGSQTPTTVSTGVKYPSRIIFVNPGPATGAISTTNKQNVTFSNVTAAQSHHANVRRFWDGSNQNYTTRAIRLTPAYNEFEGFPVTTTSVAVYRESDRAPIGLTSQSFIQGNRITLVTIDGNFSTAAHSTTVVAEPVSASTRSVTITGQGSTFNITLPTPTDPEVWNNSSVANSIRRHPRVIGIDPLAQRQAARITFDGTKTYELRLARVVVHTKHSEVDIDEPGPHYIQAITGNQTTVEPDAHHELVVEVRDRFSNPQSGVDVTFTTSDGTFVGGTGAGQRTVTTTDTGRATVSFIPNTSGEISIQAQFDGSQAPLNKTTFELGAEAPAEINPNGTNAVALQRVDNPSGNQDTVTLVFNNTGSTDRTLEQARISFYHAAGAGKLLALYGDVNGDSRDRLRIREDFEAIDQTITLPANSETSLQIVFTPSSSVGASFDVASDHFALSLTVKEGSRTRTYVVAVPP